MTRRNRIFAAIIGFAVMVAAISTTFLLPPLKPDLMARSTKIVDLAGIDGYPWSFHWLDQHRLVAPKGMFSADPSVVTIDVSAKTITPLAAVNATLRRITSAHYIHLEHIVPSPDGQWLYLGDAGDVSGLMYPRLLRVRDGLYVRTAPVPSTLWMHWLPGSRRWVTRAYSPGAPGVASSLDDPSKTYPAPPDEHWSRGMKDLDGVESPDLLGTARMIVLKKGVPRVRGSDVGYVSPDKTRIAWLRQGDWLDAVPAWLKSILNRCGYASHPSGEIWITRIDGTERQDIGRFGNDASPSLRTDIMYLNWTPDGKCLVFDRGKVLYSVPATKGATR